MDSEESQADSTAPRRENLEKALGMLRGELNKTKALAAVSSRRKVSENAQMSRFCPVCNRLHTPSDLKLDGALKSKPCLDCDLKFSEGMTALVGKDRRIFWVYCDKLVLTPEQLYASGGYPIFADLEPATMAALEKKFQQQAKVKDETGEQGAG